MYRELLERIADEQRRFGNAPQAPSSEAQIERLLERVRAELRTELPREYLDFLRLSNGLDWNGVVLYASETLPIVGHADRSVAGIVDTNLGFRDDERFHDLLVLGSDGMDLYAHRISTRGYEMYDDVPHELVGSFDTFDELLTRALTRSLS
jgi:hypothetical protein